MTDRDKPLIDRCLARDLAAYEDLYRQHARRVWAYLTRSGFDHADADDLTQETFVRVFRSLATFDAARGAFRTWINQIARNVARNQWARRKKTDALDPELAEETLAAPGNPRDTPEAREERQAVDDCVGRLPTELGQMVRLRYVDGHTTRGLAEAVGMPEATVRLRLKEAMGLLETCLKSKGIEA